MKLAKAISQNIKTLREQKGLSQTELAERTGVSVRYISQMENSASNVSVEVVDRLAKGLQCSASDIFLNKQIKVPPKVLTLVEEAIRLLNSLKSYLSPEQ